MRLFSGTHQRAFFIWDRTERPAGMDQATVLKRFIEAARSGEQKAEDQYSSDFMRLRRLSTKYRTEKIYPTSVGEREENVKKNRYKDILPFDHSRVKLTLKTSNQDSDYINANFIKGIVRSDSYIATQGPLPNTVLDFWRMIWEYDVTVIVMACREFEMGRKKCERYFPMLGDEKMLIGPFQISCESEQPQTDYIIRTLSVEFCQKNRRLTQFHYMNWPDHDVPSSFDSILDMIEVMREYQQHDHMPICVHCSAGCGRTGAICAIDYTRNLLKAGRVPDDFNVFQLIQEMRTQRHSAVQTKEQYELVHRAITQLFEKQLKCLETDGMDESSPEKLAPNSDEEHWDVPPPKPPRLRSHPAEDDVKEEILQPPEPRPVPPILTPSPPSAFPTVTDVRQDNDRYHPKPILHVLTSDRQPDLNENYQPPVLITQPPSPSPSVELTRPPERKLSIEIKKVPLQEGPRSFEGNGALQRAHAFKRSNTSSSSASEDSDDPPRPNHLPLKANKGHAARPVPTPDRADRTPSPAPSCATASTSPRTALSFTNPLHSDLLDVEGHSADGCSGVTVATSTVSVASQGCPSPRKVTSMSIAGQNIPTQDSLDCDVTGDCPPPLPTRTPESFLLASDGTDGTDGTVVTVTSAASSSSQGPGEAETPSPQLSACHLHSHTAAAAEEEGNPRLDPEFGSRCAHPKGPREPPSEWT